MPFRSQPPRVSRIGLGLWPLVMTIFFCVSGGPYGLEPVMQSGRGMGLLLILIVPFVWALPIALMSAELGSAIPKEGGYYEWVKQGIGPRSAVFCGWLTYLYSWVDVAIYPVLFLKYLGALGFETQLANPFLNLAVTLAMVVPLTWVNIRGAVSAGKASLMFAIALLAPFFVMILLGVLPAIQHVAGTVRPLTPTGVSVRSAFGTGLFVILWNYLGWDSLSTISGEVPNARQLFPRALMIGLPLVVLTYAIPVFVGLHAVPDVTKWTEGSWPMIAEAVGGRGLGLAVGIGGLLSAAGLFVAGLLAASRIPFVLANDGYLPKALVKLHSKFGTPARAIILSAAIYILLSRFSFAQLAEVDVLLYSAGLLFEFIALIRLRKFRPELQRPFRIAGGYRAVVLLAILPTILIIAATAQMLTSAWRETTVLLGFAALTGSALLLFSLKSNRTAS